MSTSSPPGSADSGERLVLSRGDRRGAILELIGSARRELLLSVFRCDDFKILDALATAVQRGVQVRALFTPRAKAWAKRLKDLELFLGSMGAEVNRYRGKRSKYHAKYIVADGERALVASLNFTYKCLEETCDFILITHDSGVVSGLARLFQADCQDPDGGLPKDLSEALIVGPEWARSRYLALLGKARRSIRLIDHRLSDPEIVALLRQQQSFGVSVEVLGREMLEGLVSHGRMLLVDDSTAVIGSMALSKTSLDERREVAVVIREPESVGQLQQFFEGMTRKGPKGMANFTNAAAEPDDEEDAD